MADTKQIILTGEAALPIKGGKRRSLKKNKSGGGSTQGAIVQLQSTTSSSETSTANVSGTNPSKLAEIAAPVLTGGKTKVVLKAPTKKVQKVVLTASKPNILKPITFNSTKNKTKKMSKKIQFSLKTLRKKLNVAKTIKKNSEEKSLDEIKKILEDVKLLKVGSKAPESMIRQIYNDFMSMKHKAL